MRALKTAIACIGLLATSALLPVHATDGTHLHIEMVTMPELGPLAMPTGVLEGKKATVIPLSEAKTYMQQLSYKGLTHKEIDGPLLSHSDVTWPVETRHRSYLMSVQSITGACSNNDIASGLAMSGGEGDKQTCHIVQPGDLETGLYVDAKPTGLDMAYNFNLRYTEGTFDSFTSGHASIQLPNVQATEAKADRIVPGKDALLAKVGQRIMMVTAD